jgi:Flp pilus assembly protein TadG
MQWKRWKMVHTEEGSSVVELAIILPLFLLVAFAAIDFGRAYYLANEVAGAAHAAAVYGSQNITDTTGMTNAAKDDAPDVSGLTVTPSWGCQCSDGTSRSVSCAVAPSGCSASVVYYATVSVTAAYMPMLPWTGINSSYTISGSSTMRSASE